MNGAVESFKNLGPVSFALFWFFTAKILWKLNSETSKSISSHMASRKRISLIFGAITLLSTLGLLTFFIKWFFPTLHTGIIFNLLILAMLGLYGVAGIVPDTKGTAHRVHATSAVSASVLLLPAMAMMVFNQRISVLARVFTAVAIFVMLSLWVKLRANRHTKDKFLIHEAAYFICFDLSIIIATYVR